MVRNEDDRGSLVTERRDDPKELIRFVRGDRRRWFIENQDACFGDERLGDLRHLLQRDTEAAYLGVRIERHAECRELGGRGPIECRPVDDSNASQWLATEIHVATDVEMRHEIELLMDGADTKLLRR